jgi:hypothetical protein
MECDQRHVPYNEFMTHDLFPFPSTALKLWEFATLEGVSIEIAGCRRVPNSFYSFW